MTKAGYKTIITALLLMAFTSQSIASLWMSCQHNAGSNTATMDGTMAAMHHDMSAMTDMNHMHSAMSMDHMDHTSKKSTHQQADCCETLGHCSSSGCSLAAFVNTPWLSVAVLGSNVLDLYNVTVPTALSTSLFRPPILR